MADFHAYEITVTAAIAVPADSQGNPATFDLSKLNANVKAAVTHTLADKGLVGNVTHTLSTPAVEVTLP